MTNKSFEVMKKLKKVSKNSNLLITIQATTIVIAEKITISPCP